MTTPSRHRPAFGLLAAGLLVVWLILQRGQFSAALARNAGFIAFNHIQAAAPDVAGESLQTGIARLERAASGDHGRPSTWRALGYLQLMRGAEEDALAAWRHSAAMPAELLARGKTAEKADDLDAALLWYLRATRVAPAGAEGWWRAGLVHEARGEPDDALALYEAGARAAPDNGDLPYRQAWLMSRAPDSADWAAILSLTDRAIARGHFLSDRNALQSHTLRAESLRQLGREAEALAEYAWVMERQPDNYWAVLRYGELTWRLEGDLDESVRLLERAIELDGANKWGYIALARVYDAAGRRDEAARLFNDVLALDPNDQTANAWFKQRP